MASNRKIKLAAFDMEGCLTRDPTLWEIMHRKNNTWDSYGVRYWEEYLTGRLGYDEFAAMDVATWRGAPLAMLEEAAREVPLMPGCRELAGLLQENNIYSVVISNGLMCAARRFKREFGFARVYANTALSSGGFLTGELRIDVPHDAKGKILAALMAELGIGPGQTAAVGDSIADIAMFQTAGTSIAVCPGHSRVREAATHTIEEENLLEISEIIFPGSPVR